MQEFLAPYGALTEMKVLCGIYTCRYATLHLLLARQSAEMRGIGTLYGIGRQVMGI